jgi:hypothetical protein
MYAVGVRRASGFVLVRMCLAMLRSVARKPAYRKVKLAIAHRVIARRFTHEPKTQSARHVGRYFQTEQGARVAICKHHPRIRHAKVRFLRR